VESVDGGRVLESWLVRVRGRVQGVGFRDACRHEAKARGVTGWVRNRMDGSLEVLMQGSPERLEAMCGWLREGEHPAMVDRLDIAKVQPPFARFDHFGRLPTV
jgi:acylphosphatase